MHFQTHNQPFQTDSKEENFEICLRLKPLSRGESSEVIRQLSDTKLEIVSPYYHESERTFQFDRILSQSTDNPTLFESCVSSPIANVLAGFNSTVLIYGSTGAGKTYTMFGDGQSPGVVTMTLNKVFNALRGKGKHELSLCFYEIYNETIRDLLQEESSPLQIMEDPHRGVFISELSEHTVYSQQQAISLLEQGIEHRAMNATRSNEVSSRSHAIFQLTLKQFSPATKNDKVKVTESKLFLVDLAGNEKSFSAGNSLDKRFVEGININKSLLTLGKCISILAEKKSQFVPFRDSKLTRILKQSLGGNSKTVMIACISLEKQFYEETLNTLKYSSLAKNIKNKKVRNVKEIDRLVILGQATKTSRNSNDSAMEAVQQLVLSTEEKMRTLGILENLSIAKQKNQELLERTKDPAIHDKINQLSRFMDEVRKSHEESLTNAEFYTSQLQQILTRRPGEGEGRSLHSDHSNSLKEIQLLRSQLREKEKKIQILEKQNNLHMSSSGSSAPLQELSLVKSVNKSIKLSSVSKKSLLEIDVRGSMCLEKENMSGASKVFNKKSREIVIDLNSKPSREQFIEDLKAVQKRIRDPLSQKEIQRLSSLHDLYQYQLSNAEQCILRKLRFYQDKKGTSNDSRYSTKGLSLGKHGK